MLRFNVSNKHFAYNRSQISIHLMLRFNIKSDIQRNNSKKFQYILCYGSTSPPSSGLGLVTSFQYILCYGSTLIHQLEAICARHFNTSYVTVQQQQISSHNTKI